jgi:hypothetical protein
MADQSGYWFNAKTGKYWKITEHLTSLSNKGFLEASGLSTLAQEAVRKELAAPESPEKRANVLKSAMAGGLIRVRAHRFDVSFEYTIKSKDALWGIYEFMQNTKLYQLVDNMRISNARANDTVDITWKEFKDALEGDKKIIRDSLKRIFPKGIVKFKDLLDEFSKF